VVVSRFRRASTLVVALMAVAVLASGSGAETLRDIPIVWYVDDRQPIERPAERDPSAGKEFYQAGISRPGARLLDPEPLSRRIGSLFGGEVPYRPVGVNALGEVPSSSWFTNRIGLFPMTPEEVALGPGDTGPDRSGTWVVVGGKAEGVTPGFLIQDPTGQRYLLKFDAPGFEGMTSSAGAIAVAIFHSAGYNVPLDVVVEFERSRLVVGGDVKFTLPSGEKRVMNEADLDSLLARVKQTPEGKWRGLASRFLSGRPVGPFDWKGTRRDDANDHVNHQDHRELRGLRMFAAWLDHFDTKQSNTLDMYVGEEGEGYVKHNLIDFASSLGAGGRGPAQINGEEYGLDFPAIMGRTLSLGLHEDPWRSHQRPRGLSEIGFYQSAGFHPMKFKPQQPNTAFANLTHNDAYWAAKIISAFSDEHIEACVARGKYRDPAAHEYMTRTIIERRDILVRYWFDRVPPLDFIAIDGFRIRFRDLGVDRGLYTDVVSRYRMRCAAVDRERDAGEWSAWTDGPVPAVDLESDAVARVLGEASRTSHPFVAIECQLDRGEGWSSSVTAYVSRKSGNLVAVER
jgi:hypothetical protein